MARSMDLQLLQEKEMEYNDNTMYIARIPVADFDSCSGLAEANKVLREHDIDPTQSYTVKEKEGEIIVAQRFKHCLRYKGDPG